MAQTNKSYIIELEHQVTGKMTAWKISPYPSPSAIEFFDRREKLRSKLDSFKRGARFDIEKLSAAQKTEFSETSRLFDEVSFKLTAMILTPDFDLPEGVGKDEYLRECIGLYEVFDTVIGFFLSISSSSGKSQGAKAAPGADLLSRKVTLRKT